VKRKYTAILLACMMLLSVSGINGWNVVSHAATPEFEGGSGTAEDPWKIATAAQLDNVRNGVFIDQSDKHFILVDNIYLNEPLYNEGAGWLPIGSWYDNTQFQGSFDGNGKIIYGLTINRPDTTDIGLFGYAVLADIKNVSLIGVDIIGNDYTGSLIGTNYGSDVSNSYAQGSLVATYSIGGLIGDNTLGNLTNTYAAVSVSGSSLVGGLVGSNGSATITNSYYNSEIAGLSDTGKGEPRSTADMTYPYNGTNTYIGWDFDSVWDIQDGVNSGYPFLRQQQTDPPGEFAGGDGSEANPFQITTAAHLNNVRNYLGSDYTDKHFLLMNDIDLTSYVSSGGDGYNDGKGWQPIGYVPITNINNYTNCFYGSFDGGEHTISGLFIDRQPASFLDYEQSGLFGALVNADIRNLNLGVQVKGTRYTGGLAGYCVQSTIDNIQVEGDVTGNELFLGGLIGTADVTVITDSSVAGTVNGSSDSLYVGGLIGSGSNTTITGCQANTTLSGAHNIGGLTGHVVENTMITESNAAGMVTGTGSAIGGLSGYNENSSIGHSFSTVTVSGSDGILSVYGVLTKA
jgi:hypothetical protein